MVLAIVLDRRKKGLTDKGWPVVVYFSNEYASKKWRIGHYAKDSDWNTKLGEPKPKHPEYYVLKDKINAINARISTILRQNINMPMPIDEIKKKVFNKELATFFEAAIAHTKNSYTDSRYSAIISFCKMYPNVRIKDITRLDVQKYIARRLAAKQKPAGVDSYIRSLRSIWPKISETENPFRAHKIEIPDKVQPAATAHDIQKLASAILPSRKGCISGAHHYRNYWLLMFYLGGIDPEVLIKLRYDTHVVNGRIIFNRNKGQSKKGCNNVIPDPAYEILKQYDCYPYLVPIYQSKNVKEFINNFTSRFKKYVAYLQLSVAPHAKSARHSFIDRAQQLLIDERITAQIVGHKRKTVTSLYTNDFPKEVQDKAHLEIVNFTHAPEN